MTRYLSSPEWKSHKKQQNEKQKINFEKRYQDGDTSLRRTLLGKIVPKKRYFSISSAEGIRFAYTDRPLPRDIIKNRNDAASTDGRRNATERRFKVGLASGAAVVAMGLGLIVQDSAILDQPVCTYGDKDNTESEVVITESDRLGSFAILAGGSLIVAASSALMQQRKEKK